MQTVNHPFSLLMALFSCVALLCYPCAPAIHAQQVTRVDTIRLTLFTDSVGLDEVTVRTRKKPAANSRFSDMLPVELVTIGGANGDLYKALQTLPGSQMQGENGRLLVRGGSSEETQTFMDGLHVLNPYTATSEGQAARSRYSTFMFSGINLASGGAPIEYGNALSAVLPLETKDQSTVDKTGVNASIVGVGGGGTRTFQGGSASVDLNYQNLKLYNQLFPDRKPYDKPYTMASAATQLRYAVRPYTLFKLYAQYDRTDLISREGEALRRFDLNEDNLYLNATMRHESPAKAWKQFAGVAFSWHRQGIGGVSQPDDHWKLYEQEWHLKVRSERSWADGRLGLQAGAEGYLRRYATDYQWAAVNSGDPIYRRQHPRIAASFLTFKAFPLLWLKTEFSLRGEYAHPCAEWNLSPRIALNAYAGPVMLSAVVGHYTQLPLAERLAEVSRLGMEHCTHYNLGLQYKVGRRFAKLEIYDKQYSHLAWYDQALDRNEQFGASVWNRAIAADPSAAWGNAGYGYSRGLDFFFSDPESLRHLEYQIAYTYNLSRRKAGTDPEPTTPQYATRHNASVVLKYTIPAWHLILGMTNSMASGRPYHDETLPGWMNSECKPYHSLDLALTYLPTKRIIIHCSVTNVLNRTNEFGREQGKPVLSSRNSFIYFGVFLTLGKKAAYDASNF